MKRFSKTFSVMMLLPSAIAMSAMNCACMSVGKPGYGSVCDVDGREPAAPRDGDAVGVALDRAAGLLELGEHELEVRRVESAHGDRPAGERAGDDERAGLDAVADDAVLDGVQRLDALDGDGGRAAAVDARAHRVEEVDEVDDLGLARGVLDDRRRRRAARRP